MTMSKLSQGWEANDRFKKAIRIGGKVGYPHSIDEIRMELGCLHGKSEEGGENDICKTCG